VNALIFLDGRTTYVFHAGVEGIEIIINKRGLNKIWSLMLNVQHVEELQLSHVQVVDIGIVKNINIDIEIVRRVDNE
jgi:hypothetical protein